MDRFDEIWKNRFNADNVSAEEWNMPDDDLVWAGIETGIKEEKPRRNLLILWWGIALITLAVLASLIIGSINANTNSNQDVSKSMANSAFEANQKNITKENNSQSKESASSILSTKNDSKLPNLSQPNVVETNKLITNSGDIHVVKGVSSNLLHEEMNATLQTKSANVEPKEVSIPTIGTIEDIRKQQFPLISFIELRKMEEFEIKSKIPVAKYQMPLLLTEDTEASTPKQFGLGINAGTSIWLHRISDNYLNDLSPFDFDYEDAFGWQVSFDFSFRLNDHFNLISGLQYQRAKSSSGHNSELIYDVNEEVNSTSNNYGQTLATPYGLSEATFRFERLEDLPSDAVNLTVDFKSDHQIDNWSIPIGFAYYPFKSNKLFSPYLSAAFGLNYLSNISNSIHSIDANHSAISYQNEENATFAQPEIEKWHYDVRLGIGLAYKLNNQLYMHAHYNYAKGLNAIFQQALYQTKMDRQQLNLGLNWSF